MARSISFAVALLGAAAASQGPEYAQQYRQRLGGAIDELQAVVSQFDSQAATHGLDRDAAVQRLKQNADPLAQKRGEAAAIAAARLSRLEQQRAAMQDAGAFGRLVVLVGHPDPVIAENALKTFEPAIPTTAEGAVIAGMGFLEPTACCACWRCRSERCSGEGKGSGCRVLGARASGPHLKATVQRCGRRPALRSVQRTSMLRNCQGSLCVDVFGEQARAGRRAASSRCSRR